jgi:Chaperone of endosialidase
MGASSGALMKLRPVTIRYKDDPKGIKQYGLIAEQVHQVYPELVTYDA